MKAVILAAGTGSRLMAMTSKLPKPLVELVGCCLIDHVIHALSEAGIDDIVVVGGYRFTQLRDHLEERWGWRSDITISLVENPDFRSGNILSLIAAEPYFQGDLVIMNTDHLYPPSLIRSFISSSANDCDENVTIACDFDRELETDDMKVRLQEGLNTSDEEEKCRVERDEDVAVEEKGDEVVEEKGDAIVKEGPNTSGGEGEKAGEGWQKGQREQAGEGWKKGQGEKAGDECRKNEQGEQAGRVGILRDIAKDLETYHGGYIGMTFVPGLKVGGYMRALKETMISKGGTAVVEDVLRTLAEADLPPKAMDLSGYGWMEIDTPEDLERASTCLSSGDWHAFWGDC